MCRIPAVVSGRIASEGLTLEENERSVIPDYLWAPRELTLPAPFLFIHIDAHVAAKQEWRGHLVRRHGRNELLKCFEVRGPEEVRKPAMPRLADDEVTAVLKPVPDGEQ